MKAVGESTDTEVTEVGAETPSAGVPGTAYRKGQTRAVEFYMGEAGRRVLFSGHYGLDRSTLLTLALELEAARVARDYAKVKIAGIDFGGEARHRGAKRAKVDNPKRLHISLKTEHAMRLGELVAGTRLSMSAFVEECLVRWDRAGRPLTDGRVGVRGEMDAPLWAE
ncbi:MAG: hypothetical protein M0000_13210 [Actinomycetota bacterium]|nr:hypothetical protein [Actinomycetota bacterium]